MKYHWLMTIVLIAASIVFASHIFYNKTEGARVDLTGSHLYSLTQGTRDILKKVDQEGVKPIEIRLYFSYTVGKQLPKFINNFITYEDYVKNLLREYERYSDGRIRLQFIDPKPDSDEAEDAADFGLDGKPINNQGDVFYFGLVFVTQTGSKDVVDFLWPEKQDTIEYEISKRIYNLVWPAKQRIAVLSGLEVLPDNNPYMNQLLMAQGKQPPEPWTSMKVLQESYTVTRLDKEVEQISQDEYDLLLVIHPKGFGAKQLWTINEWVVTGGKTIVFLDTYAYDDKAPNNPQQPWAQLQYKPSSNLGKLMETWGLELKEDQFAVDLQLAVKRPVDRSGVAYNIINDLMITDRTAAKTLNSEVPIFQGLANVRFFFPGVLEIREDAKSAITPLITTTDQGDALEIKPGFGDGKALAYTDLNTPDKLMDNYNPSGQKILAAMIQGKLATAFPQGATFPKETPTPPPGMPPGFQMPTPEDAEMIEKTPVPEDQFKETRVIVFSDVDLISDTFAFQQSLFGVQAANDNYKVLLNSIDFMLGADELMNVRSKRNITRPFELFDQIEARADEEVLEQERRIRADIDRFQEELREKQRGLNQKDAVLFKKKLADEVNALNENIRENQKKLREIRKQKRAVLEKEETWVRFSVMGFMPLLVLLAGLAVWARRFFDKKHARKG